MGIPNILSAFFICQLNKFRYDAACLVKDKIEGWNLPAGIQNEYSETISHFPHSLC